MASGFAAVLDRAGLPPEATAVGLAGFNLGIELAQLGVALAAALPCVLWPRGWARLRAPAAYIVGGLGAFWVVQRAVEIFT